MPFYSAYLPYTILPIALAGIFFFVDRKQPYRWLFLGGCLFLLVWVGWSVVQPASLDDFNKAYYYGGRKILRDPAVLYDEICYGFTNFPLVAYLFAPLGTLSKEIAGKVFFVIGYVALFPLAYLLGKWAKVKGWGLFLILGLLALNGPLDYDIWIGNTSHLIMLVILLALIGYGWGREFITGVLLGGAGLIKLPLILPSGYFFVRGRWKVVAGGLLVAGLILVLSFRYIPFTLNQIWVERCVLSMSANPIAAYNNQSLTGFLARIFMSGELEWDPVTPTAPFKQALAVGNLLFYGPALLILFLGRKMPPTPARAALEFSILLIASVLTSPIAWMHYFVLFLIPAALYVGTFAPRLRPPLWLNVWFMISLLLLSLPLNLTLFAFEQTGNLFFLSFHFFGAALFYAFLLCVWYFSRDNTLSP